MAASDSGGEGSRGFSTKKCPYCFTYLPLYATRCDGCHKRVGAVNRLGFAAKPVDWMGYLSAIVAIAGFGVFIWWAFFRG